MQNIFKLLILVLCLAVPTFLFSQSLYDVNTIQKIEIQFSQANWDYQMDTAKVGAEGYLLADWLKVNGVQYDSVGVKYKGNSSYDSTKIKNPLNISLDEFKNQSIQRFTNLKLSNGYADPSLIREVLSYNILGNYMNCPKSNFAQVYINGNYFGLFSSSENIDKKFCGDHFYSASNTFLKCNPISNPGPTTKSNFKYIDADSNSYSNLYELKSKKGWNELVALCDTVTNYQSSIESIIDMDRVIWMLAFNNVVINLDSYSGVFAQNHYSYRDNTNHFNPIVWDLNMSFGSFPFAGLGGTSMGNLTTTTMQTYSPFDHATDSNWPLINAVNSNATYKRKYVAHCKTILTEFISNGMYSAIANQFQALIDTAVQSDNNKLFSYAQFQNSMNTTVNSGSLTIPGIQTLMDARATNLLALPEFTASAPVISSINSSITAPLYNDVITMTCNVTNATSVIFGYRFDKRLKFKKISMYDDGMHNDGVANDNIFGVDISMQSGNMQYYVYAENNDAGIFSPARAEHEFYELHATLSEPSSNEIVINEFLADNSVGVKDEYDSREDWIELFNNSSQIMNLSNLYLTDDLTNLTKWQFPADATINPNGYFTIWADDDASQLLYHTNFNLSKDSGIIILSNASGLILDSISYGAQLPDFSYGRYPNGTGSFINMNTTYGDQNNNYPLNVTSFAKVNSFKMFPNPANSKVEIQFEGNQQIQINDMYGRIILRTQATQKYLLNTIQLPNGIYTVRCGNETQKLIIAH